MIMEQSVTAADNTVAVAVTGSGGAGVMTAGDMLLQAAARAGLYGLQTRSVGPQIRGGEAAAMMRLSHDRVASCAESYDILVAIDWENLDRFAVEIRLRPDSLVIGETEAGDPPAFIAASGARVVRLPMLEIIEKIPGGRPNMVALGALAALVGLPEDVVIGVIGDRLAKKGEAAIEASVAAVRAGAAAAAELDLAPRLKCGEAIAGRWLISGNEAAALGAVRGGVRFVAAYPITPATEVLEWLAPALAKVGGALVQAEDELASINMAIGASYGGVPALTATSGPGLALMTESIGLAVAAEVPIVIVDVMRGGPSTGIPTKSEQSDLNIAVYGVHGDAPHIVVAPASVADCIFTTQWAVHLAEAMQVPAIVLSDQFLGQSRAIIDRPADVAFIAQRQLATPSEEPYQRYAVTESGVSPMAVPGMPGCQYTADGLEHSVRGTPSTLAADHQLQLDKRNDKLENFDFGDHWAEVEGSGEFAVITWGSSATPAREALALAAADGIEGRLITIRLIAPAQPARMAELLTGVKWALIVEQSHSAQFLRFLRAHYDLPPEVRGYCAPGSLPVNPAAVRDRIVDWS